MKFYIDQNAIEYEGKIFMVNDKKIFYRKGKITPKKIGEFVTFYKRINNTNLPLCEEDEFEYLIIKSGGENKFFVFSKELLMANQILTAGNKKGKMAFRLYPDNTAPISTQAIKTQMWQLNHFREIKNLDEFILSL